MPNSSQRKSGRRPKPSQKRKTRSASPLSPKPPKKRAKPAKFIHPSQITTLDNSEEEDNTPEPKAVPVAIKDVSSVEFTVDKCCVLDKEPIWNDADFVKLGEFAYQDFHQQTIRRVTRAAEKDKKAFEWVSGQAKITSEKAKQTEATIIEVEDESGWKKVEQGIERWLKEKNKGAVTVKLTCTYKTLKMSTVESSEDESPVVKKGGKSRTDKLIQKERAQIALDTQHVDPIMERWRCGVTCPNKNGFCYVVDGIHLRMLPGNMKTWSMAINDGKADLETAPATLAATLMPSKSSQKNPFRETQHKTPAKEPHLMQTISQTPSSYFPSFTPLQPHYNPYLNTPAQYPPVHLPYIYPVGPAQGNSSAEAEPKSRQRSSSLPSEFGDLTDKLEEYFMWLTKIAPGMKEQLAECLTTLKKRDIVLDTLPSLTDAHYSRWENEGDKKISDGIRLLIGKHLKKWKRTSAKGRV